MFPFSKRQLNVSDMLGVLLLIVLGGCTPDTSPTEALSGVARVIDGDTLELDNQRIRLHGIDAPESKQTCTRSDGTAWLCGNEAKSVLEERIKGIVLLCKRQDTDIYGRIVAICYLNGEDINAWLVSSGWALAYREFSLDYTDEESDAMNLNIGLWDGEFDTPWDFRDVSSAQVAIDDASSRENCLIKGNVSDDSERIYHIPGGIFYERTVIDLARNERWFCTEDAAINAGWRKSLR